MTHTKCLDLAVWILTTPHSQDEQGAEVSRKQVVPIFEVVSIAGNGLLLFFTFDMEAWWSGGARFVNQYFATSTWVWVGV